eukprot:TRINITY_DN814_c0_g1_i5.p1 TRINITY_DN814_c0_g1~~TRINITY_DN814_c0_g1_i5.p1  ORF type:complete len:204 (+),score=8.88 TRINITY_DN814_c0_g1_i5:97-708(+)
MPLNDLHVYDTKSQTWLQQPACRGPTPCPRHGHSITLMPDGRTLLLFGGCISRWGRNMKHTNDVHLLDTTTMTWRAAPTQTGDIPCGRRLHTATLVDDHGSPYLLVVGGAVDGEFKQSDEIFTLDLTEWHWTRQPDRIPAARYGHCASYIGDNRVIVAWGSGRVSPYMKGILHDTFVVYHWNDFALANYPYTQCSAVASHYCA